MVGVGSDKTVVGEEEGKSPEFPTNAGSDNDTFGDVTPPVLPRSFRKSDLKRYGNSCLTHLHFRGTPVSRPHVIYGHK